MTPQRSLLLSAILVALSSSLTACGGGGSNVKEAPPASTVVQPPSPSTPPAPTPEAPPVVESPSPSTPPVTPPAPTLPPVTPPKVDPIYRSHLDPTRVTQAQAKGLTGAGVKLGMIDSGVNEANPALHNKVVASMATSTDPNTDLHDPVGHGSIIAQLMVGDQVGRFTGGVAPNADLYLGRTVGLNGMIWHPSDAMAWMAGNRVQIVNNSWNTNSFINPDNPVFSYNDGMLAASADVIANNGLIVFATGNNGKAQPGEMAVLPHQRPELEKGWLAVAAVGLDGITNGTPGDQLEPYSNACGWAKNWCLVTPGTVFTLLPTAQNVEDMSNYGTSMGTSAAAPQVSAAAALVWEAYPWMTNDQVRKALLSTTTDLGEAGVDEVYGYGLMNAEKAVNGLASFEWGTETLTVTSGYYEFNNGIRGTGGVVKEGQGTLSLTANNTYQGDTVVNQGVLGIVGSVASNVQTTPTGTLFLSGSIDGNLSNNGRVRSVGGTVNGSWTQGSTGHLEAFLGEQSTVTGTFAAAGKLTVLGTANNAYVVQGTETLLTAGAVTGTFDTTEFASGLFLSGTFRQTATAVEVDVVQTAPSSLAIMNATPMGTSSAEQLGQAFAVGNRMVAATAAGTSSRALDAQQGFLASLASLQAIADPDQAIAAANTVSGQWRAMAASALLATQQAQDATAFNRTGTLAAMEAGSFFSVSRNASTFSPAGWATTQVDTNDVVGGADVDVGKARLGALIHSSQGDMVFGDQLGRYRINTDSLGLYGRYALTSDWRVMGQVRFGRGKLDGDREVSVGLAPGNVHSLQRYDQWAAAVRLERGFETAAGTWVAYAGASHYSQTQDASEDVGTTGFERGTEKASFAATSAQLGGQFQANALALNNGWSFAWSAGAEYAHRHDHDALTLSSYYLVDRDYVGDLNGTQVGQDVVRGFLDARFTHRNASLFLRADGATGDEVRSWGMEAGVKLHW